LALCTSALAQPAVPIGPSDDADEPVLRIDGPLGPIEYFAGRGLRLGGTGLTVGGFTTLEIDREEHEPAEIAIDGVNLLVLFEPLDFLSGFAEIEIGDLLVVQTDRDDVWSDPNVQIERLYADLSHGDALNLRFGKFLTPIGRWNLVPAEPFVWTASEPVLVETAFDEFQTGGALFGSLYPGSGTLGYWLYGQFLDPLDPSEDPEPSHRSAGSRFEYTGALERWSIGTSFLASELDGGWSFLSGVDARLQIGPLELTSEFAVSGGDLEERDLWGVYLQGVYGLGEISSCLRHLYLVGRYEHFDPSSDWSRDVDLWDLGVAWQPLRFLNIKAGYRLSNRETDEVSRGLTASLSVLF
jgi:hypothetical protein